MFKSSLFRVTNRYKINFLNSFVRLTTLGVMGAILGSFIYADDWELLGVCSELPLDTNNEKKINRLGLAQLARILGLSFSNMVRKS